MISTMYVDSKGRQFRIVGIYSGCLVAFIILVFLVVLVEVMTFALFSWPNGWSRIAVTMGSAVGPLLALAAISRFRRTVQYRCRSCQHQWLSAAHSAERLFSGQEQLTQPERLGVVNDLAQHADPLAVNALLAALQDRDMAVQEAAASKLRGMLGQLDDLPATKAGAERTLQEYDNARR